MKDVNIASFSELHSRSRSGPLGSKKSNIFIKSMAYLISFLELIPSLSPQFMIVAKKRF
jgi:hypothetical protein